MGAFMFIVCVWHSQLHSLMRCCCRRKKFLQNSLKMIGPWQLLALRENETAMDVSVCQRGSALDNWKRQLIGSNTCYYKIVIYPVIWMLRCLLHRYMFQILSVLLLLR